MNSADAIDRQVYHVVLFTLIPFIAAFSFIVFVLYRRRRESSFRLKEAQFSRQVAEVEMKALRAQINPHFIFNCIQSAQDFIHRNDLKNASSYLNKFSKLTRLVLENSVHKEIYLVNDMQTIELYLQLEQIYMQHKFEFTIHIDPAVNHDITLVPPLIIQPFVENSIKHGFKEIQSQGLITIHISREDAYLKYVIEDNGVENTTSATAKNEGIGMKKTSMGMSLVKERLDVLNKTNKVDSRFIISDIRSENNDYKGKRVELFLPFEEEF
jgi:LytS/YehU family sensor histidine kinase